MSRTKIIASVLITILILAAAASAAPDVLYLKVNDLQPYYYAVIKDSSENPVDLTGATVVFTMKSTSGTVKIDRQAAIVTDAANGKVEYRWQAGDTDTDGRYYVEFEVSPASGGKFTVPASPRERAGVIITDSLDAQ